MIDSSTVDNNYLRDYQDLTILKILNNLKALKTDKDEFSPGIANST